MPDSGPIPEMPWSNVAQTHCCLSGRIPKLNNKTRVENGEKRRAHSVEHLRNLRGSDTPNSSVRKMGPEAFCLVIETTSLSRVRIGESGPNGHGIPRRCLRRLDEPPLLLLADSRGKNPGRVNKLRVDCVPSPCAEVEPLDCPRPRKHVLTRNLYRSGYFRGNQSTKLREPSWLSPQPQPRRIERRASE